MLIAGFKGRIEIWSKEKLYKLKGERWKVYNVS